jgi:preprotein translocase subunit SecE
VYALGKKNEVICQYLGQCRQEYRIISIGLRHDIVQVILLIIKVIAGITVIIAGITVITPVITIITAELTVTAALTLNPNSVTVIS